MKDNIVKYGGLIFFIISVPIGVNWITSFSTPFTTGTITDWISFYGSYLGAVVGGLVAFIIARVQIKSQMEGLEKQLSSQQEISKTNKVTAQLPYIIRVNNLLENIIRNLDHIEKVINNNNPIVSPLVKIIVTNVLVNAPSDRLPPSIDKLVVKVVEYQEKANPQADEMQIPDDLTIKEIAEAFINDGIKIPSEIYFINFEVEELPKGYSDWITQIIDIELQSKLLDLTNFYQQIQISMAFNLELLRIEIAKVRLELDRLTVKAKRKNNNNNDLEIRELLERLKQLTLREQIIESEKEAAWLNMLKGTYLDDAAKLKEELGKEIDIIRKLKFK